MCLAFTARHQTTLQFRHFCVQFLSIEHRQVEAQAAEDEAKDAAPEDEKGDADATDATDAADANDANDAKGEKDWPWRHGRGCWGCWGDTGGTESQYVVWIAPIFSQHCWVSISMGHHFPGAWGVHSAMLRMWSALQSSRVAWLSFWHRLGTEVQRVLTVGTGTSQFKVNKSEPHRTSHTTQIDLSKTPKALIFQRLLLVVPSSWTRLQCKRVPQNHERSTWLT